MRERDRTVFVFNKTKETFLGYQVKVADSTLSRLIGLLGKRSLEPNGGLWIVPSYGVHTLGMLFTIDVVFVDRNSKVVALRELLTPFSITSLVFQAESVLELPPHTIFKSRTEVGDELVISSFDAALAGELEAPGELPKAETLQKVVSTP